MHLTVVFRGQLGGYWNQFLTTQKSVLERGADAGRKETCLNQNAGSLGRWWPHCPAETGSKDSAQLWKCLKGKGKSSHLIIEMGLGGSMSFLPLTACRLADLWSFPRCQPCLQFVHEVTEGEAREEIGSSVNYLVFSFACIERTNRLGRVLCGQQFERWAWARDE